MSKRVGLELTHDRIRAVTLGGWRSSPVETFELKWDSTVPRDAVALLSEHLGRVTSISVAVGLGFTHVKHVALPPAPDEERRAMLTLEPDRFFAVDGGEMVAATRHDSDLVFAADAPLVDAWVTELERWAPVSCYLPNPCGFHPDARSRGPIPGGWLPSDRLRNRGLSTFLWPWL